MSDMEEVEAAFKAIGDGVNQAMREFVERGTAFALAYAEALREASK